ncbi:xanthine dehydrogenase family protein molybdopterin-binding subunit [Palleronia sediminis]|uniref:Xanthine dehydrogenase family protein molybdopterin-binding subunit n=1 Tax=Palleronia sediminis TaxID=2547833 RepID=A0A4R6AM01_9RHOB|nr:xanthine dehydrogenase family protein molybdopterin-binding subunit [Palleronia sediminis]TDL84304.1 xanthine dehydrogenase family protein molybdopterin-binding subunit [Palleronia sediminis]
MQPFGKSQSVARREDIRFLTGAGRYVDDIAPEGALVAVFVRAPVAHARIVSIDLEPARAMPGVAMVLDAAGAVALGADLGMGYTCAPDRRGGTGAAPERPFLARGRVRFVGEPVAMVVAATRAQALDAAEAVEIEYDDLPAKIDLAPGGAPLHDEAPDNLALDYAMGDEARVEAALAAAAHRVAITLADNRIHAATMEPRNCFATWDGTRLSMTYGGQGVWDLKDELIARLNLAPEAVHVTTPDVGGGFGMKGMNYPEYFAVALAARETGRPVRWSADRSESMLTDNGGRDLVSAVEMGFDADLRLVAYRVDNLSNLGAYNSNFGQMIQSHLFARVLTGVYDVQAAYLGCRGIYTNTAQVDAYRGAGRPEAIFALERAMDRAARELGVDPWDLRRRNFIAPDRFPYTTVSGETYDVGDFPRLLDRAAEAADLAGLPARRAASRKAGRLRGVGLCYYIESILGSPDEGVQIAFTPDGGAEIRVGTQSNGQGHETVFARFLSDQTGIPVERIAVVQGDSDLIAAGGGTGGSRSVTVQTNVTLKAVGEIVAGLGAFLAERVGVPPSDVSFDDERFRLPGSNETPTMLEAAAAARDAGREDLLTWRCEATLRARSFPNGAHVAEVEIDPETGRIAIDRYTVIDDFGNLINPMLAEGQVHGGVVQGLGQALSEQVVHDADGQLLSASFMDYAVPRAADMPRISFENVPVPSTANAMGMKGCGEAGTVGALAAVANAVEDALWPLGVRDLDLPMTPHRVWEAIRRAAPLEEIAAE